MGPDFSLKDRLALVTGSSRGLGAAIAAGLAGAGARVILHGRDSAALADQQARTGAIDSIRFDVTDEAAVLAGFAAIAERHGPLDILINNAGVIPRKPLLETTDADWQQVIDINLTSCFRLSREAARVMMARKRGRIIIISSVMGQVARPTIPGYITAKAGLFGMTRALAVELAPHNITVNALAPGFFPTDATEALHANESFNQYIVGRAPMARWGRPEELAGPAVFLASDAASFVTGHILMVDGGLTAAM